MGMTLCQFLSELFGGLFGTSTPYLTLLSKKEAISYTNMGSLSPFQQGQIFAAIGKDNHKLLILEFGQINNVDPMGLASALAWNETLHFVDFGLESCDFDIAVDLFSELTKEADNPHHAEIVIGLAGQAWTLEDRKAMLQTCRRQILLRDSALPYDYFNLASVKQTEEEFEVAKRDLGLHDARSKFSFAGLVLWLDASLLREQLGVVGTGEKSDQSGLAREQSDSKEQREHDILEWRDALGRHLFKSETSGTHCMPPSIVFDEAGLPAVEFSNRSPKRVQSMSFSSEQKKDPPPAVSNGTIISVHGFINEDRHWGSERKPFTSAYLFPSARTLRGWVDPETPEQRHFFRQIGGWKQSYYRLDGTSDWTNLPVDADIGSWKVKRVATLKIGFDGVPLRLSHLGFHPDDNLEALKKKFEKGENRIEDIEQYKRERLTKLVGQFENHIEDMGSFGVPKEEVKKVTDLLAESMAEDIPFQGRVSELLVFDRILPDDEIAHVEKYLRDKWSARLGP